MNIPNLIKTARESAGLNQTELAMRAGVSQTTVSAIERGDPTTRKSAIAIIQALPDVEEYKQAISCVAVPVFLDGHALAPEKSPDNDGSWLILANNAMYFQCGKMDKIKTGISLHIPEGYTAFVCSQPDSPLLCSGAFAGDCDLTIDVLNLTDSSYMARRRDVLCKLLFVPTPDTQLPIYSGGST